MLVILCPSDGVLFRGEVRTEDSRLRYVRQLVASWFDSFLPVKVRALCNNVARVSLSEREREKSASIRGID